mmetsp:Transcript_92526/g.235247  ORF Transcript_92526/g.235247 Transcript_92526/m.235247 type:complete len:102 (+) Transcript_92526:114-419(+)
MADRVASRGAYLQAIAQLAALFLRADGDPGSLAELTGYRATTLKKNRPESAEDFAQRLLDGIYGGGGSPSKASNAGSPSRGPDGGGTPSKASGGGSPSQGH